MDVGDKIKIFPDTNIYSYTDMIHNMGFNCYVSKDKKYIKVLERRVKPLTRKQEVAKMITEAMKEKGYTDEGLAKELGTSAYTVWNWKHALSIPNDDNQKKIKKVLGVKI